ncbi:TrmH family RNA methyltransferase [Chlamydia gallinacea]|uniref:23S rRNA methyltransferase n=2 Tax=Chlamydia gallinacea TaxID=1457153 RepID=A0A173DZB6_9CHLA|nr:RNA methyltransferase [Chlamydia gallinacea]EYE61825.1 RNA 2'-O ribose methyltransferase substrate binding family protein [Bacteroides fragilis str. S6L5]ANG66278.1 23S rRNA methyltransferase [Chlamydia gallinacea 08-1274/3]AQT77514.1 23S rRNA methyltransferase [Chlamydia gallinacea]MBX6679889.1 RNA methyltransferase [Chlamydia gallinacea]MBX6687120.1 RNA methyltransferase [Chlamydia gallinacea]
MEFIGKNNLKVKEAIALRRNHSKKGEWFLLEGFREIQKALDAGYECLRIFCSETLLEKEQSFFDDLLASTVEKFYCEEATLAKLSYKEHPDHFVAVMRKRWWSKESFLNAKKNSTPFYIIIEQVEKPGNLGSILRIADAVGVDGVILCDSVVDLYNPNVIRASLGTVFSLPLWLAPLEKVLQMIAEEGWQVFVTSPYAHTPYFYENYQQPLVCVFGSEKDGVSTSWLQGDFTKITLPMQGKVDSLNLSTAVSAIVYEIVRQRWNSSL